MSSRTRRVSDASRPFAIRRTQDARPRVPAPSVAALTYMPALAGVRWLTERCLAPCGPTVVPRGLGADRHQPAAEKNWQPAPAFTAQTVVGGLFKEVSLADYLGQWVFLLFYPMDFTFVCPTEILAFNDALPQFAALNTAVLGVSTDSEYSHFAWAAQDRKAGGLGPNLKLPLVADRSMRIARDYGVLIEDKGVALRGLFLVDPKGVLRQATINDLPVGRSVDEALRLVKAFQFNEQYGEVCPANWTEGARTIKADPTAKLEYFEGAAADAARAAPAPAAKRARVE